MPRAALRKPHPDLDLTAWLKMPEDLPPMLSSQSLFGNDLPLEIEVGSGKGLFVQTASENCSEHNFFGIEIARKYAAHAAARLARRGRSNAMMLAGDASPLFASPLLATTESTSLPAPDLPASDLSPPHLSEPDLSAPDLSAPRLSTSEKPAITRIASGSLEAVHVYFPDPWWKKRHRKRRVLSEANIRQFSRCLRPGGRLHFWTDVLDYFELTVELIAEIAPELGVPLPQSKRESTHDLDYHTHFERRSRQFGIPVYRVYYRKRGGR